MNLEEYINALQVLIKERPELRKAPVYYASDDEGNAFRQVWSNGTVMYTTPDELNNYELENIVIEFNNAFTEPLKETEVQAVLRCIPKAIDKFIAYEQGLRSGERKRVSKGMRDKEGYWYKNETL